MFLWYVLGDMEQSMQLLVFQDVELTIGHCLTLNVLSLSRITFNAG